MQLTFSNKSNAIRGFRQHFPMLSAKLTNDMIRVDFIDAEASGYSINLEAVADYQQDALGVVSHGKLQGVPMLRRSVSRGSVHKAHSVFATLPAGTARKDAVAAAVASGIAFYTARTQYQRWASAA